MGVSSPRVRPRRRILAAAFTRGPGYEIASPHVRGARKTSWYEAVMNTLQSLSNRQLLDATRALARHACEVEADLLVHLAEIDERKLYLECAFPSMFAFCVGELGFSEDAAYSRILVARASRRLPAVIEAIRSGSLHLTGARLLAPHLTGDNHVAVLERAAGKSKREIE